MAAISTVVSRQHLHESNLIEGFDDPAVDEASFHAWVWLRKQKVMTHDIIQELNKRLTAHQPELDDMWRGAYRSRSRIRVMIGGRPGMKPAHIGRAMDNWLEQFPSTDPIQSHIDFEHIHPFIDGNGRTGRMLMWWSQKNKGQSPTLVTKAGVADYYSWF